MPLSIIGIIYFLIVGRIVESSFFFCCYSSNAVFERPQSSDFQFQLNVPAEQVEITYSKVPDDIPSIGYTSILKNPGDDVTTSVKSVTFSSDTKFEQGEERRAANHPSSVKIVKHRQIRKPIITVDSDFSNNSPVFIGSPPFNYKIEDGNTIEEYMNILEFPEQFIELISTNYPGLKDVQLKFSDLAGLVLFAFYCRHPAEFFQSSHLRRFFNSFLDIFPDCRPLINSVLIHMASYRVTKVAAFNGLIQTAFDNSLVYTVEAFYVKFGNDCAAHFLKTSIKSRSMESFKRFYSEVPDYPIDKILAWAIENGNEEIYDAMISSFPNLQAITKYFRDPIIIYLAKKCLYFPGIVEKLVPMEFASFEGALTSSVMSGNHKLFRDLIKCDNEMFPTHNPLVLNTLRSIFSSKSTSTQLENSPEYLMQESANLEDVYMMLLRLDCDDPEILEVVRTALPDLFSGSFINRILLLSLFSRTRDYFKMITSFSSNLELYFDLVLEAGGTNRFIRVGILDIARNSKIYGSIAQDICNSQSFSIFHAFADPQFPRHLWDVLIMKFPQTYSLNSYKKWSESFSYNSKLLELISSNVYLDIWEERRWNYLELAVLNFNPTAVEAILSTTSTSPTSSSLEFPLNIANNILSFFELYLPEVIEPYYYDKVAFSQHFRKIFPRFYIEITDDSLDSVADLAHKLNVDMKKIFSMLKNHKK